MEIESRLKKLGTLGGSIKFNKENAWAYGLDKNSHLSKERLFGQAGRGPLHPGMPYEEEVTLSALHSDTKQTLIRELADQTHLTREESERVVEALLRKGILEEIKDPTLGKILVFKEGVSR